MRNTADPSSICSRVRATRLTPLFNNWNHGSVIRSWLIEPIIAQSEMAFYRYRDSDSIAGKAVALMRHGFGGHPFASEG